MFKRPTFATIMALGALVVGCDVSASSGPAEALGAEAATLRIVSTGNAVVIEADKRLEARIEDALGNPMPTAGVAWTTSDTVLARVSSDGRVEGKYYGSVTVRAEKEGLSAERPMDVVPGREYSGVDIAYFREIAFGAEYGSSARIVRKWGEDLRIMVHGTPTPDDMEALRDVVADLRMAMGDRRVDVVSEKANIDIYFVPEQDFASVDPHYESTNYGFFWVWWGPDQRLNRSRILISATDISQEARSHLIREELTQSLGLMNDSWSYPESIYYQGWTRTNQYAPIDLMVIEMLYRGEVQAGMTEDQALGVLNELPRRTTVGSVAAAN